MAATASPTLKRGAILVPPLRDGIARAFGHGRALLLLAALLIGSAPARAGTAAQEAERAATAAREEARQNRNDVAAVLFEWAVSLAPSRRREWLREWADQLIYSGHAGKAVPLYRELLAGEQPSADERHWTRLGLAQALSWSHQLRASLREYDALLVQDPKDLDARLGRARVLSWIDRNRDSLREYEAVLRQDPGNVEARRGLGRVQSWRGHQRDAQRRLAQLLQDHPGDAEGMSLLAQSQDWMGRPDRAKETLHGLLAHAPDNPRGKQLLAEIERRERPTTGLDVQQSHQSDHLTITAQSFQHELRLDDGRTTVGPRFQRLEYVPERGPVDITVNRPGVFARHRFNDRSELTNSLWADLIEPETGKSRTVPTYDTYLTLWPNDLLRFDVGSSRTTFDNIKSLTRGITGTYASFSMDVTPDELSRLTTRFNWGSYSDGNTRRWAQVEVERRVRTHPNLLLGARYTHIDFSKLLDNGYFNPETYHSAVATVHLYGHDGSRFSYDLDGSYGRETARPGGGKPFSSGGVRLHYWLGGRVELEGRYGFFSSQQASSGGFSRQTAGLFLRVGL
jgi:tetratricopeptide (TPR) repeat protein